MIKTNMIRFPHEGVKLTPNPSERDLCAITQERRVPRKAQGLGLCQPNSSNLISKIKSGSVFLPGRTFMYEKRVALSHCLSEVHGSSYYLNLRGKIKKRGEEKKRRGGT